MKQYPKKYGDISRSPNPGGALLRSMGSSLGTVENLAMKFRDFYREAHLSLFDMLVKEAWLEQKFLYDGARRVKRSGNGMQSDSAFSYFVKAVVGISQKPLTDGMTFVAVTTYFRDFFPNFSDYDPFTEKEYFKYPYEHVTLDHLSLVYQCHNRLELLKEAEDKKMSIHDFQNWASNWVSCYNDEVGDIIYRLTRSDFTPYIKKMK